MKRTVFFLFLLLFPVTGCMREDLTDCAPEGNLLLHLSFEKEGQEFFSEVATSVDILLFDTLYQLVRHERIEDVQVLTERMVYLTLEEGSYYLAAWLNCRENSTLGELVPGDSFFESYVSLLPSTKGDPLYYGPQERAGGSLPAQITIRAGEKKEERLSFSRSHRTLSFYIEGVVDRYSGENLPPLVQIGGVPIGYDLLMNLHNTSTLTLRDRSEFRVIKEREMAVVQMHLPLFPVQNNIRIEVRKNSDNSFLTGFSLPEYLRENPPEDAYEIPIYIGFFSGGVEITLPGWGQGGDVTPEW